SSETDTPCALTSATARVPSTGLHRRCGPGSSAVGYQTASARKRWSDPAFISGVPDADEIVKADNRLACPEPRPSMKASHTRTWTSGPILTCAYQRKAGAVGATRCSAVNGIHRAL